MQLFRACGSVDELALLHGLHDLSLAGEAGPGDGEAAEDVERLPLSLPLKKSIFKEKGIL